MTDKRLSICLHHLCQAATDARDFVDGLSEDEFLRDRRTQQAVIMSLTVLGEIATTIIKRHEAFASAHPEIEWHKIRGMRNRIVHEYFNIDLHIVWQTVQQTIPGLLEHLRDV